jgi:glycosyltransferase involved in cell wall biosynthesis
LKICHVITTLERGGAENAVTTLSIAQSSNGNEVTVLPLKGQPELTSELRANGVKVNLELLNKNPILQITLLRRVHLKNHLVHAHLPRAELLCRIALHRKRLIITRHNTEKFMPRAPKFLSKIISCWVTKDARIIAISNAVNLFLQESHELHRSSSPTVIYYGYQRRSPDSSPRDFSSLNSAGAIKIGTIGRLTHQKNINLLLQLTKSLVLLGYQIETSIVGSGPLEKELKNQTQQLGISQYVNFLGRQSNIMQYLKSLDLFILTSHYEGFGLVLLEAMDASTPIIASKISAIPEILGTSHPGLFEPNSKQELTNIAISFIQNEKLRNLTVRAQYLRLNYFSVERMLSAHDMLYRECNSI